jgi:hypothetical protein
VLTTKFDILRKPECPVSHTRTSSFIVIRLSLFLNGGQLYIFYKMDHAGMFSGYARVS